MKQLIKLLHSTNCSCVISNGDSVRTFHKRGVTDLLDLLDNEPQFLDGANVADKVVGKAAAALLILGNVNALYADKISIPALSLLKEHDIDTSYGMTIDHVQNRKNTDWCPLEKLCYTLTNVQEMHQSITNFLKSVNS